jgi:putative endonuclease
MTVGERGEEVVVRWLIAQGGEILARRWRWRGGEIDTIAISDRALRFVEVKTRSRGNWDEDGLMAVTPRKQQKLIASAELFIAQNPQYADFPCQFDVAIVRRQALNLPLPDRIIFSATDRERGERLLLLRYINGAFEI